MRKVVTLLLALLVVTALAPGASAQDDARADLEIDQPDYIDESVDVERTDNATIYHVNGPEQTITVANAAYDNVTGYGVLDGPGSLEADDDSETFRFDAEGSEATTAVYFDITRDGSTTRYVADIRVSNVEWAHVPADKYAEQQSELSQWESIKRDAQSAVPGADPVETIKGGIGYEAFFDSPTASLRADMQATLMMLFLRPGGLFIAGLFVGTVVLMLAKAYRYRNRMQKQLDQLESIDREMDEAWLQKARKILQQVDLNELFPDHIARAMREHFGRNTWLAFKQYSLLRSPTSVKGTMLQMMAQVGYVGVVERDESGHVLKARVVQESDLEGDTDDTDAVDLEKLDYEGDVDREIIQAIPADDLDEGVFDADLDLEKVSFPIDNREVSDAELINELSPAFPGDFEDREELAQVLGELMGYVANHDHTDDEGNVRREMDLLSFMMEMDTVLHDEADFPTAYLYQKELLAVAEQMDKGDRLDQRISTLELDGISSGPGPAVAGGD